MSQFTAWQHPFDLLLVYDTFLGGNLEMKDIYIPMYLVVFKKINIASERFL